MSLVFAITCGDIVPFHYSLNNIKKQRWDDLYNRFVCAGYVICYVIYDDDGGKMEVRSFLVRAVCCAYALEGTYVFCSGISTGHSCYADEVGLTLCM